MIAPPEGEDVNSRDEMTVTVNDFVTEVYPDLEKVRVMLYSPVWVGVPDTVVPVAESQEAPLMETVQPSTLTVGEKDQ